MRGLFYDDLDRDYPPGSARRVSFDQMVEEIRATWSPEVRHLHEAACLVFQRELADDGTRHSLEDVATEFGINLDD